MKVITKLVIESKEDDEQLVRALRSLGNRVKEISSVASGDGRMLTIRTSDLADRDSIIRLLKRRFAGVTVLITQYFAD